MSEQKTYSIRMAKADKEDLDAAYQIMNLLDSMSRGYYPSSEEGTPMFFDSEDVDHLHFLHQRIIEIAENSGGVSRVVGAAGILLNEENGLIDPNEDCIELHPVLKALNRQAEPVRLTQEALEECKRLADAGSPVSEGVPTKTYPPKTLRAMIEEHEAKDAGEAQWLAPEDYEMPPADPVLLAMANRELSLQLSHIAATCADYLPDPSDITTARAVEIMDMLIDAQRGQIESLSAELPAKDYELVMQARRAIELGVKIDEQDQSIDSLTKDVINTRAALNKAINEADRLRAELAAERQAREALQEQDDAVDVTDAAVGYLIRAPKRKPRLVSKPERARDAALAAVRAGAGRAEVLAMVPVGVARRGAEWQESGPRANGD